MTVTVYKSTDASAPVLTGQVGALTTLLDAILVNGYGSKSSQGWSIAYTATNQRSYRQVSGTNQRYLNVEDTIAAGAANYSKVTGYETMSAFGTGTGPFPTVAQFATGLFCIKSATADATARPWFAYGNGKIIYLFIAQKIPSSTNPVMSGLVFGDFTSYVPSDAYNTIIISGTTTTATATSTNNWLFAMAIGHNMLNCLGHFMARSFTQIGSSCLTQKWTNFGMAGLSSGTTSAAWPIGGPSTNMANNVAAGASNAYPNACDGGLYMERLWLSETGIRGELPGIWAPLHSLPITHLDTFSGTGTLAGKTFEALRSNMTNSGGAMVFMETSNTW